MIGLIGITVTFVVFHVVLSRLLDLDTWAEAANQLLHTVVPVLALAGWVAFGPRGLTSARIAKLSVVFPLLYMAFALIRGPLNSDWYPYPFADAKTLGYFRVLVNAAWIMLLFAALAALAAGATALDRRLRGGGRPVET
ncbi:MAG: Pr6Pr family membrane protein [Solirubrobacteraceae bacterium]